MRNPVACRHRQAKPSRFTMWRILAVITLTLSSVAAQDQIKVLSVVNSASFEAGIPSGGALATIFCTGLTVAPGTFVSQSSSPLPFQLGGVQVMVNGVKAPILAVVVPPPGQSGPAQINIEVPHERNSTADFSLSEIASVPTAILVIAPGANGSLTVPPGRRGIGGFFSGSDGYAVAFHSIDNSAVTLQSPARPGETISVYANDFFEVWPPPPIGFPTPSQVQFALDPNLARSNLYWGDYLYLQAYPPTVPSAPPGTPSGSFASTPALQILFRGLAPNMVGVEVIRFVVPANQQPGDWALFFNVGSCPDGNPTLGACGRTGASSSYVLLPVR